MKFILLCVLLFNTKQTKYIFFEDTIEKIDEEIVLFQAGTVIKDVGIINLYIGNCRKQTILIAYVSTVFISKQTVSYKRIINTKTIIAKMGTNDYKNLKRACQETRWFSYYKE